MDKLTLLLFSVWKMRIFKKKLIWKLLHLDSMYKLKFRGLVQNFRMFKAKVASEDWQNLKRLLAVVWKMQSVWESSVSLKMRQKLTIWRWIWKLSAFLHTMTKISSLLSKFFQSLCHSSAEIYKSGLYGHNLCFALSISLGQCADAHLEKYN